MNSLKQILHLEDNKNDAELVKEILALNDINCKITLVDNKSDFEKELKRRNFSIILADYNLPNFDGLEALKIVKKEKPEIPFIFMSGVLGEELAIETLKQGATDYVIKSRPERLVPAIQRALKEKEEKAQRIKLEREIADLEQITSELRSTYEQLTKRVRGFLKIEIPSGKYTVVDRFLEDLSGYEIKEWQDTPHFIKNIIHTEYTSLFQDSIDQMVEGIIPKLMEYKIVRSDGEERWWLQFNIGAFDVDGKLTSVSSVIIDNTENKDAQLKYQNLFENATVGMYRTTIETGDFIEANEKMAEIFGFESVEEFKKKRALDFYPNKKERITIIEKLKSVGSYEELLLQYKKKDGSIFWVSESARIYPKEGYIEGMVVDVTDRKNAEDALIRDRRAFQIIAEAIIHSKDIPDLCNRIVEGLLNTLNFEIGTFRLFDPETKILNPITIIMDNEEKKKDIKPLAISDETYLNAYVARTKEPVFAPIIEKHPVAKKFINRFERFNAKANITWPILGSKNELLGTLQIVSYEPKEFPDQDKFFIETIVRFFTTALDQKWNEKALLESQNQYRRLIETTPFAIINTDLEGKIIVVNKQALAIFGFSDEEEMIGTNFYDYLSNEDNTIAKVIEETNEFGKSTAYEFIVKSKLEEKTPIELSLSTIRNEKQDPETFIFVCQDITERKIYEEEQKRLSNIITFSDQVVISADIKGTIIYVNPAMERIFGYTQEELIGKPISILSPDNLQEEQSRKFKEAMKKDNLTIESVRKHKNGTLIPVIINITTNKDEGGNIHSVNGIILDISEFKKLEYSLQSKYHEIEVLNKVITAGYRTTNLDQFLNEILEVIISSLEFSGGVILLIDDTKKTANMKKSKGIQKNHLKILESFDYRESGFKQILVDGETMVLTDDKELESIHSVLGFKTIISLPFYSKQKIIGALVLVSKIEKEFTNGDKKILEAIGRDVGTGIVKFKMEEELIDQQRNLQAIFDAMDQLIFVFEVKTGLILNANKTAKNILGLSDEELSSKTFNELSINHTNNRFKERVKELFAGKISKFKMPLELKDGISLKGEVSAHKEKYAGHDAIICLIQLID